MLRSIGVTPVVMQEQFLEIRVVANDVGDFEPRRRLDEFINRADHPAPDDGLVDRDIFDIREGVKRCTRNGTAEVQIETARGSFLEHLELLNDYHLALANDPDPIGDSLALGQHM